MNKNKSLVLTLTTFLAMSISHLSLAEPIVGYGSSDAVLPAKNQELFLMGFEMGFQKSVRNKSPDLLVLEQVSDGSQLGAIAATKRLLTKEISMLVGFPSSHEALLAANLVKDKKILTIFSGAGHSELAKMGPTIFTTGESMTYSVETTLSFIRKKFSSKRGLLISNPYAVFSKDQENTFIQILSNSKNSDVQLKTTHLKKDLLISEEDIKDLQHNNYDYIVLTPYADESAKLLEQLERGKIDLPLLTNSSWTTGDVDFGRRFLTARKSPAYSAALWIKGSADSKEFESLVQQRYGRTATAEIAYGYDLGIITGTTIRSVDGLITKESVLRAFLSHKCFSKLSSGTMCFKATGGHALRKITFVRFTKHGFVPVK